jgi:hypothetical protein
VFLVANLIETPPLEQLYTILKKRLLLAHQLTPVQKAINLMGMPDLGDRRLSQMLAELLQIFPPGETSTLFPEARFCSGCRPAFSLTCMMWAQQT